VRIKIIYVNKIFATDWDESPSGMNVAVRAVVKMRAGAMNSIEAAIKVVEGELSLKQGVSQTAQPLSKVIKTGETSL